MGALATTILLGWAVSASAVAGELAPSLPGLSRVVVRCTEAPDDPCWEQTAPLERFAAAPALHIAPVRTPVRLGWDDDGLLVRVDALPDGTTVEVGLGFKEGSTSLSRANPLAIHAPGIHRLVPERPLSAGELRRLWVNVVVPDGAGWAALPWTPAGMAMPSQPARILLADAPGPGLPVELRAGTPDWLWSAVGGDEVRLAHLRRAYPRASRGVPPAWSQTGEATIEVDTIPDWGWVEAVAVWRDPDGLPVDLIARRVWSEPEGTAGVSGDALFFPPPKQLAQGTGEFQLPPAPVVCADGGLDGPVDLFVRELQRMTGATATAGTTDCTVSVRLDEALPPQGFSLVVTPAGVELRAAGPAAATWGVLAVVDALGPDGRAPVLEADDHPTVGTRPLYHSLNLANRPDLTLDDYIRFVERVVTRGRYTQLHLFLSDAIESPARPELARPKAWTADDIGRLRAVCDALGIELVPGVNAPGHTTWMLRSHPELAEDVNGALLDVRHPDTRALLSDHYTDVWEAFGRPSQMHLGHDEVHWQTDRWFEDERNPRTSASPRALLFAEDLRWHLDWCAERGITPYLWTDMLLAGWNGSRDGTYRALELLSPEQRGAIQAMAWSPLGEPLTHLSERWGIDVLRVHTGYLDWKREGIAEQSDQIAGEGLALFIPAPWAAFAPGAGSRPLHYHLANVILAGATAWEPALAPQARIEPTLAALAGHPVLRPGYEAIAYRKTRALFTDGARPDASLPGVAWPSTMRSDAVDYRTDPHVARKGASLRWAVRPRDVSGVSILVAADPSHTALARLRHDVNRSANPAKQAVGWLVLEHEDGSETRRPLEYGEDIYALVADPRAVSQWRAADVVSLASPEVAHVSARGRDRRLYRVDIGVEAAASRVLAVRLEATRDGIPLVVGAASLFVR